MLSAKRENEFLTKRQTAAGPTASAIADYSLAIRTDPTLSAPWHNRAQLFLYGIEYDRAIADYAEAIKSQKYPEARPHFHLAFGHGSRAIADRHTREE